ncbi:hypothetical protein BBJ29_008918 [Phytophthora kernoviae]|uniref:Eukaryotic translation initiation factor 3 subunit C n=1 Tax=Phytophthora kernoviae TaxID=325452 RepID=A0A3F2RRS2_9STRA|nr:hypothetical protein BBJ29_008918 [Phytophthora kernoviae]RLN62938.1 hypothetical protein BBP00_00004433 [Phytophthora kernoviae]
MPSVSASPTRPRRIPPRRIALVLAVCASDLLLTGLVFGWAPLLLLLQEEGQYHELCEDSSSPTCVTQENRLNLIFAVASVAMNAGALPVGMLLDRVGPRVTIACAAIIEVSGLTLLALADSQQFDVFVPAYLLIAFGGCITMMASYPASFLIMRYQTAILAAISCLFDGSSVMFLVLYAIHEHFGLLRRELFLGLAVVAAAMYLLLIFLWGLNEKSLHSLRKPRVEKTNVSTPQHEQLLVNGKANDTVYGSVEVEQKTPKIPHTPQLNDEAALRLVDVPISKQMKSFEFAYIVLYAAVQVLRATIYIGTANKLLENYGDREHGYLYTKVFSFVLPLGFLFVPSIDYLVETRGLSKALLFTNVLGVIYNVLVLIPNLPLQCVAFFIFTSYRAFLYAIMSAFTAKTFGLKNLGSLMGIIFSIGSVISLAEYPAVYLSNSWFGGDLTVLNSISLLSCLVLFPLTSYLRKYEHDREEKRRTEIALESGIAHDHGEPFIREYHPPPLKGKGVNPPGHSSTVQYRVAMASRFWAGGSSSEEESDVSDVSDVETSQQQQQRAASRWAVQSDSDSDEEVRVVKSAKDKALENMERNCANIKNHMKINDWTQIQTEFDELSKLMDRAKKSLTGLPIFYVRTMVALEDFLLEKVKNKAEQKKMSKENSKALIRMKGKVKKTLEPIRKQIDDFRAKPVDSSEEESSESSSSESSSEESSSEESDSDSESGSGDGSKASESESEEDSDDDKSDDDDDSSADESWPSNSSSSSSSSEDDDNMPKGRARWLKQTPVVSKAKKVKGPKVVKQREARRDSEDGDAKKVAVEEELKLTPSQFDRRVKEVIAMRGKKGMDLSEQLNLLRKLANYARRLGPARQLVATMYLVGTSLFDTSSKIDRVMSARHWKLVQNDISSILALLEKNPDFSLAPLTSEDQADIVRAGRENITAAQKAAAAAEDAEEDLNFVDTLPQAGKKGTIKVSGDLAAFVERLSEEYTKSLQQTDPHTSEYVARLFDENLLIEVAERVQTFCARKNEFQRAATMALVRAELIYYKHDTVASALFEAQAKRAKFGDPAFLHPACTSSNAVIAKEFDVSTTHPGSVMGQPTVETKVIDAEKQLREVCRFVFQHGDIRAKTRAMLCRIYHHALHDRFHEARDLLLMSHIQDNITDADIPTQILFNRMMAQLGLCAFRCGLIWEAHACLSEICTGSRTKELLAQGLQSFRYGERDLEQERLERRRQVPYHMHINLDLLETCHLVSAMLLEVPNMVNSRLSDRKRMVSKAFRKLLEFHERLVFEGPPENPRDHVVSAAKLLAQGSWRKSADLLVGLPVWDLFPGANVSRHVKSMVQHKIQVEALRTYLLAFSEEYDSVSLARLMEMFELDDKTVHSVVSKMMINEELHGAWDQSSQAIVLYKTERSTLQTLAVQYSDKLSQIVENNERMMDLRSGTGKEEWGNRRGGGDGRRGGGGRIGFSAGGGRRGDNQGGRGGFRPRRGGGGGGGRGPRQQRQ